MVGIGGRPALVTPLALRSHAAACPRCVGCLWVGRQPPLTGGPIRRRGAAAARSLDIQCSLSVRAAVPTVSTHAGNVANAVPAVCVHRYICDWPTGMRRRTSRGGQGREGA